MDAALRGADQPMPRTYVWPYQMHASIGPSCALADWLEIRIRRGQVQPFEEAAIARTWAAFTLGGLTEQHILQAAKVVQRAHAAIRQVPRSGELQQAINACAGVLYGGLPRAVRERMPLERVVATVRMLEGEADAWAAIVEGVADIAGWRDYARIHAASVIRAVIETKH